MRLKKELATHGEELPPAELLPAKRKEQSSDPTQRDASREEFRRRALAGGNMWESLSCLLTLFESFDINNPAMGADSVARQMHEKTVQHYWVNTVKQQVMGGECPTLRDTLIQPMEAALNLTMFLTQEQALLGKAQQNANVNKDRQYHQQRPSSGAQTDATWRTLDNEHTQHGGVFCRISKECTVWMSPQEAGDGREMKVEFQVQIKRHNQRKYEGTWQLD